MATESAVINNDNVIIAEADQEKARLQRQHQMMKFYMPNPTLAPLDLNKPGLHILDQATADGTWLFDLASSLPDEISSTHTYTGTDIATSYFPTGTSCPSNFSFSKQSMTDSWPSSYQSRFDLVHSRLALLGSGTFPPGDVIRNLAGLLRPSGWIQLVEIDTTELPDAEQGPALKDFFKVFRDVGGVVTGGRGLDVKRDMEGWVRSAGLERVVGKEVVVRIGKRADTVEMRELSCASMVDTARGFAGFLKNVPPQTLSHEQLQSLPERFELEMKDVGGVFKVWIVWGQKPEESR